MSEPSEQSSGRRRWTLSHDTTAEDDRPQAFRVRGPEIAFGSVEVMPVAEHERLMKNRCTCVVTCGDRPEDEGGVCKLLPRDDGREWTRS